MKTNSIRLIFKRFLSVICMAVMLSSSFTVSAWASSTVKCYLINNVSQRVYSSANFRYKTGSIYSSDEITVLSVGSSYCKVSYPVTGTSRSKTGYIPRSAILTATSGSTYTAKAKLTTYKRPGGQSYGYISKGDRVTVYGTNGNCTQVKYPVSGGYKYAFVKTSDVNTHIKESGSSNGSGSSYSTISEGTYKILTALNTSYALDVHNYATSNGGNVEIFPYHDTDNEKWIISSVGSGYYVIKDKNSGKVLDVSGGVAASNTNVQIYESNGTDAQKWRFVYAGNNYYYIVNALGYYLDVQGGTVCNGNNVWVYTANGTASQKWRLSAVDTDNDLILVNPNINITPIDTGYAAYTGVRYDNIGLSSQRVAALNKAKQMVTIKWTAPVTFPTWCSSKGTYNTVKAADGTKSTEFIKGRTYIGIPYSMCNHSWDDLTWKSKLSSMTSGSMTGTYYKGKKTTANGIDCSYFVYTAFKTAVPSYGLKYQTTKTMLSSSYYRKISLSEMKPGDLFLKNGHVMMYVGKSGSNYAVFEADANDSKASYNVYTYSYIKNYSYYRFRGFND